MPRYFFGVPIPAPLQLETSKHLERFSIPGKIVPSENFHITLLFLGNVEDSLSQRIVQQLKNQSLISRFEIQIAGLGAFPKESRARTLWMGVQKGVEELKQLFQIISTCALKEGFVGEPPDRFHPHLTVSRLKIFKNLTPLIQGFPPLHLSFTVDRVALFESHLAAQGSRGQGSRYEEKDVFPLQNSLIEKEMRSCL